MSPYNFTHIHMQFSVYDFPPHLFALNLIISSFICNSTWLPDVLRVELVQLLSLVKRGSLAVVLRERKAD